MGLVLVLGWHGGWLERFTDDDLCSLNGRTEIWKLGWELIATFDVDWVRGLGLGGCDKFLATATKVGAVHPHDGILRCHSHNMYLELAIELGAVGVVLISG